MKIFQILEHIIIYTGEDLKWHAPKGRHYNSLPISDS